MITETDLKHLNHCVQLAEEALLAGDEPFGSILVSQAGEVLFADHNHVSGGDSTQHPEFAIARWAAANLSPEERQAATTYTSGEHCPMCAAAHGLVGLGRIVYASSSKQLTKWKQEMNLPSSPVNSLAIQDIVPNAQVEGPVPELADKIRRLHQQRYEASKVES